MYSEKEIKKHKAKIIDWICNGKSLLSLLKSDKLMPSRVTVYKWLNSESEKFDEEFLNNYTRAMQDRSDYLVEEIMSIADDQCDDVYIDDEGKEQTNHNVIARSRIRIDTRKWVAAKMQPKKYGDKQTTVHEGGEKPIEISFEN